MKGYYNFLTPIFFSKWKQLKQSKYAYADTNVPPSKIYVWEALCDFKNLFANFIKRGKKFKNKFTQKYKCRYLVFISDNNK